MKEREDIIHDDRSSRLNPLVVALLGGIVILLALLWWFGTNRNPDQDKLSNPQVEQAAPGEDPGKRCSAKSTYDLIKRELFRHAAQQRGSDQAVYDQVAAAAVLRVENPVLEGQEQDSAALNCSATFYLDLPPGVATSTGAHGLMANVDYTIEAGGNVLLRNADPLIGPLMTLTRVAEPAAEAPETNTAQGEQPEANVAASVSANVQPGPPSAYSGRPSFDCARAGTRGEIAVCSDSGLAALDLNIATQYRRALSTANAVQKQLLQTTRDRFLAYRDHCPNRQCIADAYLGRMREIRDIMEGRLTPAR